MAQTEKNKREQKSICRRDNNNNNNKSTEKTKKTKQKRSLLRENVVLFSDVGRFRAPFRSITKSQLERLSRVTRRHPMHFAHSSDHTSFPRSFVSISRSRSHVLRIARPHLWPFSFFSPSLFLISDDDDFLLSSRNKLPSDQGRAKSILLVDWLDRSIRDASGRVDVAPKEQQQVTWPLFPLFLRCVLLFIY